MQTQQSESNSEKSVSAAGIKDLVLRYTRSDRVQQTLQVYLDTRQPGADTNQRVNS